MYPEQVCPDGVMMEPNWDSMDVGMSMFIPAVNLPMLSKQVQTIADARGWKIKGLERIEHGKLGMRFWRVL